MPWKLRVFGMRSNSSAVTLWATVVLRRSTCFFVSPRHGDDFADAADRQRGREIGRAAQQHQHVVGLNSSGSPEAPRSPCSGRARGRECGTRRSSPLTTTRVARVCLLVAVIVAPGTGAWLESTTIPAMPPNRSCAVAALVIRTASMATTNADSNTQSHVTTPYKDSSHCQSILRMDAAFDSGM